MAYQPPMLAGFVGDSALSPGGFTSPTATRPVTDLGEHFSGTGMPSHSMRSADAETRTTLIYAAGIVLLATALIWLLSVGPFRSIIT